MTPKMPVRGFNPMKERVQVTPGVCRGGLAADKVQVRQVRELKQAPGLRLVLFKQAQFLRHRVVRPLRRVVHTFHALDQAVQVRLGAERKLDAKFFLEECSGGSRFHDGVVLFFVEAKHNRTRHFTALFISPRKETPI